MTVLSLLMAASLSQFNSHVLLSVKERNDQLSLGLKSQLEILFTHSDLCKQNLTSGAFGATIGEAIAASNRGQLKIVNPSHSSGSPKGIYLEPGTDIQGVRVAKIQLIPVMGSPYPLFSPASALTGTNSHLTVLEVHFETVSSILLRPIRVPFYFATDGSGVLTDCFASTFPNPDSYPTKTMENFLCEELVGSGFFFDPEAKMCIDGTVYP